jgi:hypothetical protein
MKKIFVFMILSTSFSFFSYGQKIVKNEKDDFTGKQVIETNYSTISDDFTCRIRSIDKKVVLDLFFNGDMEVYTMEEGAPVMLKFKNGEIVTLNNIQTAVSEYFTATISTTTTISHFTLKPSVNMSADDLHKCQTDLIEKVRFVTTTGYIEREVKSKKALSVQKMFNLINID